MQLLRGAWRQLGAIPGWLYRKLWKEPKDAKGPVRTTALWLLFLYICFLVTQAAGSGKSVPAVAGAVVGTLVGQLALACFAVGIASRLVLWFRHEVAGPDRDARRRPRHTGRSRPEDIHAGSRRKMKTDDPCLPLSRGRR